MSSMSGRLSGALMALGLLFSVSAAAEFRVFDATLYTDKPDLSAYGLEPIKVVYEAEMWKPFHKNREVPQRARIGEVVSHLPDHQRPVVIDIEHWPLTKASDAQIRESLSKYEQVLDLYREFAPDLKLGYYGHPPVADYWRSMGWRKPNEVMQWQSDNTRIEPLADKVDILYPSLYAFYSDREGWVKYAKSQIAEARRLAKGKPVYVFLWPQYHESNPILGEDYLPEDYWILQLKTAKQYADGIVIWGGYQQQWDEDAPWWKVTRQFMAKLRSAALP